MLIALSSKQRVQTIHAISIDNLKFFDDMVIIPIHTLLKTSTARRYKIALELRENFLIHLLVYYEHYVYT